MNYEELLDKMRKRRDYFEALDFQMIKVDYVEMISAVELLLKEVEDLKKDTQK